MFLHAIGFGIVIAALMALAAVGCAVQFELPNILNLAYGDVIRPRPGPAPRRRHPPAARDRRLHAAAGNTKSYYTITKCKPGAADPGQVRRRG